MAVLPLFADQPHNARRVARLGAGLEVAEPAAVGEAVRRLLADDSFAAVASSVAAEIDALAPIEAAPTLAHDLVERRVAA